MAKPEVNSPIDRHFWYQIHKRLFSKVWSWAGEVRGHELGNTDFLMPHEIRPALKQIEDDVKYWMEHNTYPLTEIATRLHERLLTIHPFANGNGRFSRIVVDYFCSRNKLQQTNWGRRQSADPRRRRQKYIEGILKARKEYDFQDLEAFIFGQE